MENLAFKPEDLQTLREFYEEAKNVKTLDMQSYDLQVLKETQIPEEFTQEASNDDHYYEFAEEQTSPNLELAQETPVYSAVQSLPIMKPSYRTQNLEFLTNQHYSHLYDFTSPLERTMNTSRNIMYTQIPLPKDRYYYSPRKKYF